MIKYKTISISVDEHQKLVDLQKKYKYSTLTKFISAIIDFFEKTKIDPNNQEDLFVLINKIFEQNTKMSKWMGALKRDYFLPISIDTAHIKNNVHVLINQSNENHEVSIENEIEKAIQKYKSEQRLIQDDERSKSLMAIGYIQEKLTNMNDLIKTEKGLFGSKLYVDIESIEKLKTDIRNLLKQIY